MTTIQKELMALQDAVYGDFQAKLTPGIPRALFIGVRMPALRLLARKLKGTTAAKEFLAQLPHVYYEENVLHGVLLGQIENFKECMEQTERFLPYMDNWAVCDTTAPGAFRNNKDELLVKIKQWLASSHIYTCRFGLGMLMRHFLDEDFKPEYLEWAAGVHSDAYYVNMMIAWFFATALAKQPEAALPYLSQKRLAVWVHNKTIQKAVESYRISLVLKEQLKKMRIHESKIKRKQALY